jgi:signal transduction histidine kinase
MREDPNKSVDIISRLATVPMILDVVCEATGLGFAAVARVTEDRWIACSVRDDVQFGLKAGGQLDIETTICREVRGHRLPVIIDNVADDPDYHEHPTPRIYGLQSYISMPIILPDGSFFGTLCAIGKEPAQLRNSKTINMFKLFADLIALQIDAAERLGATHAQLAAERETAALREQFIAVLGHDLRNPLASVASGLSLLGKEVVSDRGKMVLRLADKSIDRMAALIDNVMDFARGRLGGGIAVHAVPGVPLQPILEQVISELSASHPDLRIEMLFDVPGPIPCDPSRIGQLFSNLVANAISHGAPGEPIACAATVTDNHLELSVANMGDPIPSDVMERLFAPFQRGEIRPGQQGLGLGLYIAAEVAKAHGGTLEATSDAGRTRFTFQMPLN